MKKTLLQVALLCVVIALIVFGGRLERGYYAIASEPFVAVFGVLCIVLGRRKNNGKQ